MVEPWKPTDEQVRQAVVNGVRPNGTGPAMRAVGWDTWLAEHDARIWDAGYSAAYKDTAYIDARMSRGTTPNPHRPA